MTILSGIILCIAQFALTNAQGIGGASCTFDQKCFQFKSGCSLVNEFPFWRLTPSTCEECLALCQSKTKPTGPYCCRSIVYDALSKSCDLFAVAADGKNMKTWQDRIYFQPTGMPGCEAAAANNTAAPAGNACKDGETAKLISAKDWSMDGLSGKEAEGVSDADACGKACLSGSCKAAQFKDGKCTLSQDEPKKDSELKKAEGANYFRLACFKNDLVKGCPDTFLLAPQKILVGQNRQTVDKATLEECMQACLTAEKDAGFACKSGIFYYEDKTQNCILNAESAKTKPDVYTDATEDDKDFYFELGCGAGKMYKDAAKKRMKAFKDALFDLPEAGAWAKWAPCKGRKSKQIRYRPCRELDSRDCPKEERSCNPLVPAKESVQSTSGKKNVDEKMIEEMRRAKDQVAHN